MNTNLNQIVEFIAFNLKKALEEQNLSIAQQKEIYDRTMKQVNEAIACSNTNKYLVLDLNGDVDLGQTQICLVDELYRTGKLKATTISNTSLISFETSLPLNEFKYEIAKLVCVNRFGENTFTTEIFASEPIPSFQTSDTKRWNDDFGRCTDEVNVELIDQDELEDYMYSNEYEELESTINFDDYQGIFVVDTD